MPIYIPRGTGRRALDELHHAPWAALAHAYGTGIGAAPHEDVPAALSLLGEDDEEALDEAVNLLFSNVCHQGTIYEASAHAFPFIAAWAAGATREARCDDAALQLLASIALAATYDAPHGSHSGAWGEGVAAATQSAIRLSEPHLRVVAARSPTLQRLVEALLPSPDAEKLQALIDW